jgi:hypothetical protein
MLNKEKIENMNTFKNFINEGENYLKQIIKLSASDFKKTGSTIKNNVGGEVRFFDRSAGLGGTYTNGSTVFDVEGMDIQIATRVSATYIELVVFSDEGDHLATETVTLKKGVKMFRNILPDLKVPYAVFPDNKWNEPVFTAKFDTVIRNTNDKAVFILKNGAQHEIQSYRGNSANKSRGYIDEEIEKFERAGQKIGVKARRILKEIFPEYYDAPDFILDDSILIGFDKFSKDSLYLKFLKRMDKESRTGWAIEVKKDNVYVHGLIGNTSSGYRGKEFKYSDFGKTPTSMATMKKFMIKSGAIDYTIALAGKIFGEMEAYTNYMKNGGSLD